ncbi:exosome complex exonuclease Rrp41 [Candidatus Woesearchaeota archaeon]|nr:MAG: exosome complex exonuclease Rrp41 [Candidatus Woesearchaeota archaeon ex4484_78]RLE45684.1 MAG: exosome complex exonuclease Rrp41 [Candidatus Woesearchaeota archaeon]
MAYTKRFDSRKFDELRPISAKVGVIPNADGSAMFKIGKTTAYAAVYGPRDLHPKFLQNPSTGILRISYNMMPFSGHGERVRPGASRRSREIAMVTQNALLPVLDLTPYPNSVVDIFIELPQTDAGTRCAGISAAAMALADAGLEMKDLVSAVAVGRVGGTLLADLNYEEEAYKEGSTDIPVAILPNSGKVTLLQMDGFIKQEELKKVLELAKKKCEEIYEVQKKALKEKFKVQK